MLRYVVIAGVAALSAVGAAQAVVSLEAARHRPQAAAAIVASPAAATPAPAPAASRGPASIAKASDGHFWAEAQVNGTRVRFLVDTGATAVALSPDDARRLGFSPANLDYRYKVMTATGEARAAKIMLESVAVGSARVNGVEAYVIEKGLETSLLGMTYLGRLSKFEASQSSLILRP